jgi:hypothetical protein
MSKWCYAHGGWKWSEDSKTFIKGSFHQPPSEYTLGDRYIHADYGRDSYGVCWRGSTAYDWHGYRFGYDLKQAIEWVQQADRSDGDHFKLDGPDRGQLQLDEAIPS